MLNKKILFGVLMIIFTSCIFQNKTFKNKVYSSNKKKEDNPYHIMVFLKRDKKLTYFLISIKNENDTQYAYQVEGNLIKLNKYEYLTVNEKYESNFVNFSTKEKIKLTEGQIKKIEFFLLNDTIKFNKDFSELYYDGEILNKYKRRTIFNKKKQAK